jgi:Protein SCAI
MLLNKDIFVVCTFLQSTSCEVEQLLSSALADIEEMLCTSKSIDRVWAQVLPDPFLRRLILRYIPLRHAITFCLSYLYIIFVLCLFSCILRFIFCRGVLFNYSREKDSRHVPDCVPSLPEAVSPTSVRNHVVLLAEKLGVVDRFPSFR